MTMTKNLLLCVYVHCLGFEKIADLQRFTDSHIFLCFHLSLYAGHCQPERFGTCSPEYFI